MVTHPTTRLPLRSITTGLAATTLAALAFATPAAHASGGDGRVERTGSCSASADWKLKAKPDNGRIEVEAEVDSNVNGQTWSWRIKHNGSTSARGSATTHGPSGSFSVNRRLVNLAGTDTFVFRAVNPGTGEVCRGQVSL